MFSDSKNAADTRNKTSSNGSSEIVSAAELGEPVGLPNNAPVILVLG